MNNDRLALYLLKYDPAGEAENDYEHGRLDVEDFEQVLDAVILHRGLDAQIKCPRCGEPVRGIGSADGGRIAVRCQGDECFFVGYVDPGRARQTS